MMHVDVATGPGFDGSVFLFPKTGEIRFSLKDEAVPADAHNLPFRVMMSGDLLHYATVLGKEGSASAWCYICMLAKRMWQEANHELGEEWTLAMKLLTL